MKINLENTHLVKEYPNNVTIKPKVSVCIVTYNHELYISKCLDSILSQEVNFDYEILLGEDNSTDNTREICIKYANKYPTKIRLFLHDRSNVIFINNRPTGRYNFLYNLNIANGEYVAMCDGDDYWTDTCKLQKQVDFLESNPKYVICGHNIQSLINNEISDFYFNQGEVVINDLCVNNRFNSLSVVFRNELNEFDKYLKKCTVGDWPLWMAILYQTQKKGYILEDIMGVYRIHNGGIWSSKNTIEKEVKIYDELKKIFPMLAKELERGKSNKKRNHGLFDLTLEAFITRKTPLMEFYYRLRQIM